MHIPSCSEHAFDRASGSSQKICLDSSPPPGKTAGAIPEGDPMTSRPVLALMLATSLCTGASLAAPGDPFGGDEPGCFPLNKNAAKCQHTVAKAASKALVCILGCHLKRADGKLADDTAEDACESTDPVKSCKAKYDKTTGPASKINALCPPCFDATARATAFANAETQLDALGGVVYCCEASTTTTTSTTIATTTTSTTCPPPTGTVVKGSLTATAGRFNYMTMLGLPGANSACNMNFPGSHACSIQELQSAPATDLACLKDTANNPVMSFWAIDATADPLTRQCHDDVIFPCPGMPPVCPPGHTWEYGTAHTMSRGQKVDLDNATGALGVLQTMIQCNFAPNNWVGCCQ